MSVLKQTPVKALPFSKQMGFRKVLNQRIDDFMKTQNLPARDVPAMYLKTGIILLWWLSTYLIIILGGLPMWANVLLCIVLGWAYAGVGFCIMHDAIHGGYSKHTNINKLFGLTMEMLGSSSFIWRQKHNVWHHTYTNISGLDEDLETNGLLRMTPHEPWKPMFRFQHIYVPFVYSLTGFSFFLRDFRVYFTGKSDDHHAYPKMNFNDKIIFWAGKLFFAMVLIIIPMFFFVWWQVLLGMILTLMTVGVTLAAIFQLAHVMEPADFPEPVGDPLHIENEWAIHQVETTVNFAPKNHLLNWYAGGLNFQIEHHLFPHICHVHYPKLSPIVQQVCAEFGVNYYSYPTYFSALIDHLRSLKHLGNRQFAMANG